ncbi:ABC transporter ATP-binding protein [Niastella vici]|uniref:ABC transporter ATP-binding protein n=1 Tax=Niastella vici TaxID=1703345 RepID=A0A1V9FS53_9BACT|nr:peptidase domain-containing ABC transporter [Niastella vici]OQP61172.1 ABC transporter ATP-binding protein [Niastella vici]
MSFQVYKQLDAMDCGPTCLRMVSKYYGRSINLDLLRKKTQYGKGGVSLLGLADAAENIGLKSVGTKLSFDQLINDAPLPAILLWQQYHFVVLTPQSNKKNLVIADPARGLIKLTKEDFLKNWISTSENSTEKGIALLLEPTPRFKQLEYDDEQTSKSKIGWDTLFSYVKNQRAYFIQVAIGLLIGSALQLIFPYLTQSIVDTGINTQNLNFITIVLAAQLMLLFSQTIVEFIRSRILLHISTRINISLLSGFWAKLLKLPMQFFDSKHPGDIIQRISDHQRIQGFLTGTALSTLFSMVNLIIFSFVMLSYSVIVFIVFVVGSILYLIWIQILLKYRRQLDYKRFAIASKENNATMQLVYGMQEIKLNNAEQTFRWSWEGLQAGLFKLSFKNLSLSQYQQIGAFFINQGKNITITFLVAKLVVEGNLTLGAMLAIQYILGQLNSPIEQLVGFTQQAQDAKISLERLNDIHSLEDEEPTNRQFSHYLSDQHGIQIKDLSFTYPGAGNEAVLKNISLEIPQGKITAIVGMSGSGKTTLLKLLLKLYDNYKGDIYLGNSNFKIISPRFWRSISGAVMQDNFIFNDIIRKNITVTDENIDNEKLINACKTANILSFVESLPLGFYTKLGAEGTGISGGQRQRISIARAVYKNPEFIFFDEATNALDANNEKVILENLQQFFEGKTVVVVAHRLSTVKNADKIVVLENGEIAEEGTHEALTMKKGKYYELIKNQLELGS